MKTALKLLSLLSFILILLFYNVITAFAAPVVNDPGKISFFVSNDWINSGNVGSHQVGSHNASHFGIAVPIKRITFGFSTNIDKNNNYTYYEFFLNGELREDLFFEGTMERFNDDAYVMRFGAFKKMPFNTETFKMYFGPGVSLFFFPSQEFLYKNSDASLSIFLLAKASMKIVDSLTFFTNGLYDFNYDAANYQVGMAFSY